MATSPYQTQNIRKPAPMGIPPLPSPGSPIPTGGGTPSGIDMAGPGTMIQSGTPRPPGLPKPGDTAAGQSMIGRSEGSPLVPQVGGIAVAGGGSMQPVTTQNVPGLGGIAPAGPGSMITSYAGGSGPQPSAPTGGLSSAGPGSMITSYAGGSGPQFPAPRAGQSPLTPFGPGNDLRFQQINPTANQRLQGTMGAVDAARNALEGPSRSDLARQYLTSFAESTNPDFEANLRSITQRNAAGGRLGSGMYGTDLTDAATNRARDLNARSAELAYDVAGGDIQDRFGRLDAVSGLESQQFGQGLTQRNELRGERGYQSGVATQAQDDQVQQRQLEEDFLNSAFGREQARLGLLGQYGFQGNPAGPLAGIGADVQGAASQAGSNSQDLLAEYFAGLGGGGAPPQSGGATYPGSVDYPNGQPVYGPNGEFLGYR